MATGVKSRGIETRRRAYWVRVALVGVLVGLAIGCALTNIGPRGPHLVTITNSHGVDAYDLFALIPLAVAVKLLVAPRRDRDGHR